MTPTDHRSTCPRTPLIAPMLPLGACAALLCFVLGFMAACGPSESPSASESGAADEVQRYAIHGKVVSLEPENQAATIEHDEIVGWMDAMTMRFPIKEQADWDKLTEGAEINGTVFVSSDGFYLGEVEVVAQEGEATEDK